MPDPDIATSLRGMRQAHTRLDEHTADLTDDDVRRPSLLPGWSAGHVLAHLARNGDSVVRRLDGAARGDVLDQYVGGAAGRSAEIERDAGRSAAELLDDVRRTSAAVEAACDRFPGDGWDRPTRSVSGELQTASRVVFSRWREVEVHLVDLGRGYPVDHWSPELVDAWLPDVLAALPGRADPAHLLAWALGRGAPPSLESWG